MLVAAGPAGASLEDIAETYWGDPRPGSWMIALRSSARILSTQLPEAWNIEVLDGRMRIVPGDGFIDVWRVEGLVDGTVEADGQESVTDWLSTGRPFAGITGIPQLDAAASRLAPMIDELAARVPTISAEPDSLPAFPSNAERREWMEGLRRAIVVATPADHELLAQTSRSDLGTQTHIIVGDRRLQLPFGPFAVAFPVLRDESHSTSSANAFRAIADVLAAQAIERPQRLLIANAPELDNWSLELASLLIERGRQSDFSLVFCADPTDRELRWLDFVNRCVTGGCELIELATE